MPAGFTRLLAERLDRVSRLSVREASTGEVLKAGVVYLAPGGVHMALQRTTSGIAVKQEISEPVWGLRPAADVLFAAVARHFGPRSLGVVLTGMGRDGANGLRAIREVGGWTAVQDPATAVVSSMPRAAAQHAAFQLPLEDIASAIATQAAQESRTRAG
jgi:two-component system chemotaxis response regulator CheB